MFITIIKFISFFFSFHTIFDVGFCVYAIIRIFNWPSMISIREGLHFPQKNEKFYYYFY